ncbi:MAG: hypothetical protein AB1656_24160 [Candidatus Omnitrophota bacterium]
MKTTHKRRCVSLGLILFVGLINLSCGKKTDTGEDPKVTTMGSLEVTAKLVEIKGELPDIPLYDYAFVFKYEVLKTYRGQLDAKTIYVGQYNPLKPRSSVADARSGEIGGNLKKFQVGDIHRLALEVPIDDYFMGGIVNRYFEENVSPIYWAVWTNLVIE